MARPTEMDIADVVVRALDAIEPGRRVLVAGDATGRIAAGVGDLEDGAPRAVASWLRRAAPNAVPAAPWPPSGPFDTAFVRLPKARAEFEMTLHAVAASVTTDGVVCLYGANDEGIKGAARGFESVFGSVTTVDTRRHCRVLTARRPATIPDLKPELSSWRTIAKLDIGDGPRTFATYPGLFASGRLDAGTALLLASLPPIASTARVLDYGCGMGVIAAAIQAREPSAQLILIDADAVAVEAARENVSGPRIVCGSRLADLGPGLYDLIVSNPPIHDGKAEDYTALCALIADAPRHLKRGGALILVAQRRVGAAEIIRRTFRDCTTLGEDSVFQVLRATSPAR